MRIYLIGSLRNPAVQSVAAELRKAGLEVFDDWQSAGPEGDDWWKKYEEARGRSYIEALYAPAAVNIYNFDRSNIEKSGAVVLVAPCGKSAHLELGWALGRGMPGYILLDPDVARWDVMYQFATGVFEDTTDLVEVLRGRTSPKP